MREPAFLRQNREKWLEYEQMLFSNDKISGTDPDRLAELYIELTDDLAYARTFYPNSKVVKYLNGLAARTHLAIYQNKRQKHGRFLSFWTQELPITYLKAQKFFLYSFLFFGFAFLIGFISATQQEDFVRVILGNDYVDMTLENIQKGDPMAVYKQESAFGMFSGIAYNNIRVAFLVFVSGIFFSIGSVYLIFNNGVMLGAFMAFFHMKDLTLEAWPVIYIHGTLEIAAIVIAGGAGMMLGNSILFPGTYTRVQSLQFAAKESIKIMVGLVPVFFLAAWLEGYITRLTEMPLVVKMLIIGASITYILGYYIVYPFWLKRKLNRENGYVLHLKSIRQLKIYTLFFFLIHSHALMAQDEFLPDSTTQNTIRTFNIQKLDSFRNHPDFIYNNPPAISKPTWIQNCIQYLNQDLGGGVTFGKLLGYILAIITIVAILFGLFNIESRKIFSHKSKTIPQHLGVMEEDISGIDFEQLFQEAKDQKSYKRGVRLLYLETLKVLTEKDYIKWAPNKVNQQYLWELKDSVFYDEFESLTKNYEYICYGDFFINLDSFNRVERIFRAFQQKIEGQV